MNGIISQIPLMSREYENVEDSIVKRFHEIIDEASVDLKKDLSGFRVPESEKNDMYVYGLTDMDGFRGFRWSTVPVRTQIFELAAFLEGEFELNKESLGDVAKARLIKFIREVSVKVIVGIIVGVIVLLLGTYLLIELGLKNP